MAIDVKRYKKTGEKVGKGCGSAIYPESTVIYAMEEISNGRGVREVAREIGVSKTTVSKWVNGHTRASVTGGSLYDLLDS